MKEEAVDRTVWRNRLQEALDLSFDRLLMMIVSSKCFGYIRPSSGALDVELQHTVSCTVKNKKYEVCV